MARVILKKTWPYIFEKMRQGLKRADIRLADFDLEIGDVVVFGEWSPTLEKYTGRYLTRKVERLNKVNIVPFWDLKQIANNDLYLIETGEVEGPPYVPDEELQPVCNNNDYDFDTGFCGAAHVKGGIFCSAYTGCSARVGPPVRRIPKECE